MSTTGWFDSTPLGRIINRFSQDISTVDIVMASVMELVDMATGTVNIFLVIVIFKPIILVILMPAIGFTVIVAKKYLHVSRDIKRLDSIAKSPLYALLEESIFGMACIRTFEKESFFSTKLFSLLDEMNRCHLYLWSCNRWLNMRMSLVGSIVGGIVALTIVLNADTIGSTAAGLLLIYSVTLAEQMTFLARAHAQVSGVCVLVICTLPKLLLTVYTIIIDCVD